MAVRKLVEYTPEYEDRLKELYEIAVHAPIIKWVEEEFGWSPITKKDENGDRNIAWYQYIMLACFDNVFNYPKNYHDKKLAGKPIQKFVWRVGRQSGKSRHLQLGALYLAIKRPIMQPNGKLRGASIIVASKDDDAVRLIFENLLNDIAKSPKFSALMEAGKIQKQMSPYPTLYFHFWGKEKSAKIIFRGPGEGGQATRGKTFDYKIYDEADYMPGAFFEAEKATSINAGDYGLTILSSTPTGKRGYFYDACFIPGTKVKVSKEEEKNIEDLQIGDTVINRFGLPEPVTDTMQRKYGGWMATILTALNNEMITATSSHRFMAVRQKDRYCKFCYKFVFLNRSRCTMYGEHTGYDKLKPEYHKIYDLEPGDFLAMPKELAPEKLPKFCYLVGDFVYVKIMELDKFWGKSIVYNLTVGEDHSYNVHGFGVANCTKPEWNFQELHVPSHENPNYSAQTDRDMLEELKDIIYEHEILAEWGGTDCGVFDWTYFADVFKHEEEIFNPENPEEPILKPIYRVTEATGRKSFDVPNEYIHLELHMKDILKIGLDKFAGFLSANLPPRETNNKYWFGADYGYSVDPSELLIAKEKNGIIKLVARITLRQVSYEIQADIISFLDLFYQFNGMGHDSTGIGKSMHQRLFPEPGLYNKYKAAGQNFDRKLFSVDFNAVESTEDKLTGNQIYIHIKQYMTDEIIKLAQNRALRLPSEKIDKEITKQFKNHTYKISDSGRIEYSKSKGGYPDHIIDALRTLVYARTKSNFVSSPKNWNNSYSTFKSPR